MPAQPSRRSLIAGNWKMNLTARQSIELVGGIVEGIAGVSSLPEIWISPPFPFLTAVAGAIKGSPLRLAAQNMHWEASGAFTGEVSPAHIQDAGCQGVILGHSERRRLFGETDAVVRKKIQAAIAHRLVPIACIGETIDEREARKTFQVLEAQLRGALEGLAAKDLETLVVAYEPVWAIGTGRTATPAQAQEAHDFIRKTLAELLGDAFARAVRILYGGSVTPENIDGLMAQLDIDGALVGGASLKAASFLRIIRYQALFKAAA